MTNLGVHVFGRWLVLLLLATGTSPIMAAQPSGLVGSWRGDDGLRYTIRAEGVGITVTYVNSAGGMIAFAGEFLPSGFDLTFVANDVDQIEGAELPAAIRELIVARRHAFAGRLELQTADQIVFTRYRDEFSYRETPPALTHIDPKAEGYDCVLTREDQFTIGDITVDFARYRERAAARVKDMDERLRRGRDETVPGLERAGADLQRQIRAAEAELQQLSEQVAVLERDIAARTGELEAIARARTPEYARLQERRAQLGRELAAIAAVRDDYLRAGNSSGAAELERQQQTKRASLREIDTRLSRLFPRDAAANLLEQRLASLRQERAARHDAIATARFVHTRAVERWLATRREQADAQAGLEALTRLRDAHLRLPAVLEVELLVAGEKHFAALAAGGEEAELVAAFAESLREIAAMVQEAEGQRPELQLAETEAREAHQVVRAAFDEAVTEFNAAARALETLLYSNVKWRFGVELGGNLVDVAMAATEGGWAGVATEVAGKVGEAAMGELYGQSPFALFDETQLRNAMLGGTSPVDDASALEQFAVGQALKAPITLLKEGTMQVYERHGLRQGLIEAYRLRNAAAAADSALGQQMRSRFTRYLGALEKVDDLQKLHVVPGSRLVKEAMAERNVALRLFRDASLAQVENANLLRRQAKQITDGQKKLAEMRRVSLRNFAKLGASVGKGLAVDAIKARLQARFDAQEQEAWTTLFEREIQFQIQRRELLRSSGLRWAAVDARQRLEDHLVALDVLRQEIEQQQAEFLAAVQRTGFAIVRNDPFSPRQRPIELRIRSLGYGLGEEVRLLKSDPRSQGTAFVRGTPVEETAAERLSARGADGSMVNRYQFDGAALSTIQVAGALPLVIEPQ